MKHPSTELVQELLRHPRLAAKVHREIQSWGPQAMSYWADVAKDLIEEKGVARVEAEALAYHAAADRYRPRRRPASERRARQAARDEFDAQCNAISDATRTTIEQIAADDRRLADELMAIMAALTAGD